MTVPSDKARTPHGRRGEWIADLLSGANLDEDAAGVLVALAVNPFAPSLNMERRALLLRLAFSDDQLEVVRIALEASPKPRREWRRHIPDAPGGHHRRQECLERPGLWCQSPHPGKCDSCPARRGCRAAAAKLVALAQDLEEPS